MSVFQESDLEFNFTAAVSATKHDAVNNVFPGVDFIVNFIVEETACWLWVEVKNWEGASVPARRRGGQRWAFLAKMKSDRYFKEILRGKFTGTLAYLTLTGNPPQNAILYIALLESPRMDSALMLHANHRLRGLVERQSLWTIPVNAAVLNLSEWHARFPDYPTRPI